MALLFEFSDLVDLLSIGTLLADSLVVLSVLALRGCCQSCLNILSLAYQPDQNCSKKEKTEEEIEVKPEVKQNPPEPVSEAGNSNILKSLWFPPSTIPTQKSGQIVNGYAFLFVLLLIILSLSLAQWPSQLFSGDPVLPTVAVLLLFITGVTVIIWRQPQDPTALPFRAPALPVLPLVSIFVNVSLMVQMTSGAWIQFSVWNAIGFAIYSGYRIRHSLEENNEQQSPACTFQTPHPSIPAAESS
ncbi:hypothetical protein CapIbe_015078 [Capra ibex]